MHDWQLKSIEAGKPHTGLTFSRVSKCLHYEILETKLILALRGEFLYLYHCKFFHHEAKMLSTLCIILCSVIIISWQSKEWTTFTGEVRYTSHHHCWSLTRLHYLGCVNSFVPFSVTKLFKYYGFGSYIYKENWIIDSYFRSGVTKRMSLTPSPWATYVYILVTRRSHPVNVMDQDIHISLPVVAHRKQDV